MKEKGGEQVAEFAEHEYEIMASQSNRVKIHEQILDGREVTPVSPDSDQAEKGLAPVTTTVSELLSTEQGKAMKSNLKLREENEKLREVM